ncbi:hypothetical protein K7I13_11590 [Brucepastera parasyntrophica]|uniref:hypothetical protein n=1 Tax=Brucepastera parasyntrophica TaxID=2880008 RepID=UPI00210C09CD|nr:hypothetical protein [Brucepastera parasyntrophica]ULQ59136.1 hypothetical protein K7I13_11590 [Brucepastera parasyntrophica]
MKKVGILFAIVIAVIALIGIVLVKQAETPSDTSDGLIMGMTRNEIEGILGEEILPQGDGDSYFLRQNNQLMVFYIDDETGLYGYYLAIRAAGADAATQKKIDSEFENLLKENDKVYGSHAFDEKNNLYYWTRNDNTLPAEYAEIQIKFERSGGETSFYMFFFGETIPKSGPMNNTVHYR